MLNDLSSDNERAAAVAGMPCLCQDVPASGIVCVAVGALLLLATRVPTYLNRDRHKLQCTPGGKQVHCWFLTLRWMRRYDDMIDEPVFGAKSATTQGGASPAHQV